MKRLIILAILFTSSFISEAKEKKSAASTSFKSQAYMYWGWNRESFSKSKLHFHGNDYNFTLYKVKAKDRQSPLAYDPYLKLNQITIPQFNFRAGYFFNKNWNISIGYDHMKYVMSQFQTVKINGEIANTNSVYNGSYHDTSIVLTEDFLKFEHTNGLNYANVEIRREDNILNTQKLRISDIEFHGIEGAGIGILYPRTDATILGYKRNDEFHVAGFGLVASLGLNITLLDVFFIQGELREGYINMPDIRTTESKSDKASQSFFFHQANLVIGLKTQL